MTKEKESGVKVICSNRRARYDYHILDTLECGIVLVGTEVKSLRDSKASIEESYAKVENGEVLLINSDIEEYEPASRQNHNRKRDRKLLLHKREITKFAGRASEEGLTLIPLRLYFKSGRAKVELGLAKGKKEYDKRQAIKERESKKEIKKYTGA